MKWLFFLACLTLAHASALAAPANTVTLADKSGTASTSYPLQFGRPFVQGEIANYPQALINGTAVPTQADVKNRHPDGSVKFAVLAVVVPSIQASGNITLTFQNQASGNNAALTQAQMIEPKYADALIHIDGTAVSARSMLTAGKCQPWTSGPIAQTMVCADDSLARAHDVGPIRPRFHLTFWPGLSRVAVRYIGENSLAGTMIDKQYVMTLTLGGASVYAKPSLVHPFGTRWTKNFWQGGAPQPKININHNLAYLSATHAIPNLDPATTIPEATLAEYYAGWQAAPRDIYESGAWTKYMPTTGGRDDIGLMPAWNAKWLHAGDWRSREIALGQADLAGAWALHFREGRTGKKIDKAQSQDGMGLPLSVYAEPDMWFPDNNGIYGQGIVMTDRHTIVTNPAEYPPEAHGWSADRAHQPSPFYVPYLLTGDPYYLEEAQLWASAGALNITPGICAWGEGGSPCRGPGAGIGEETRGVAWILNNRVNAAEMTPDDQPVLKKFLNDMVDDAVALFEGRANITGTRFQGTPEWNYGRMPGVSLGSDPLHFESCQNPPCLSPPWQHYYLIQSLGWATERGYPTGAYKNWLGRMLTGQFVEPGYNRYNLAAYFVSLKDAAGAWYPTWTALQAANVAAGNTDLVQAWGQRDWTYQVLARAAASFLTDQPDGQAAYDWLRVNVVGTEPQFNFVPRTAVSPTPPPPPPPTAFKIGDRVRTIRAVIVIKSRNSKAGCMQVAGATGVLAAGPVGTPPTWNVNFDVHCDGFVSQNDISKL